MKHHIERTSPKGPGQQFIGVCILCGKGGLKLTDTLKECENVRGLGQDEALLEMVGPGRPRRTRAIRGEEVMDLRRLADVALTTHRSARRSGHRFKLNEDRCKILGIAPDDIKRVEAAVFLIEDYAEGVLSTLEKQSEDASRKRGE